MSAREFPTIRGRRFYPAQIYKALRKRVYSGDFEFDGVTYQGTYTPLVSREIWERVQAILDGRRSSQSRQRHRQFTLSGLVRCGHCGCLLVAEMKKGRYIYYHCTEGRGRCDDPYVREEKLVGEMERAIDQLVIAPDTLAWLSAAVAESDKTEAGARDQALKQLKVERDRLHGRIETMCLDRLDGRISAEFFDEKSKEWRNQQKQIETRMNQLTTTGLRSSTEALQIMKTVSDACAGFAEAEPQQQRAIAGALMQKATWRAGKFESSWKSPFDKMALSNSVSQTKEREKAGSGQDFEIWLLR